MRSGYVLFVAVGFSLLAGCARREAAPVRLMLMSPHRDEIREEVALGFSDWFRARAQQRAAAAGAAVQAWLDDPAAGHLSAAQQAVQQFRSDWRLDDLGELQAALPAWQDQPSREHGQALLAALQSWRDDIPPVELAWQDIGGGTSQIARYVTARFEVSPDGIGLDFIFGGGTDIFLRMAEQGLLQRIDVPAPLRQRIPPHLNGVPLYDRDGRWYGPVLSSFGILSNRAVLERIGEPQPQRWADLGRPGMFGWVAAGDPRMAGSVHMVYEIILQSEGWDRGIRVLLELGANTHSFIRDSGTLCRTVSSGQVAAAGNLDANALTAVGRDPQRMSFHLPEGQTIINPDAMAVLRGAPRVELARTFVEYLLSDAGQSLFLLRPGQPGGPKRHVLCRLSVVPELYDRYPPESRSVGAANPFTVRNTLPYDSKVGTSRWDALNDLFGAVILDAHPELAAARRAILHSTLPAEERQRLENELFQPPCTLDELNAHARRIVEEGPRARTLTVNRWSEEARQRYSKVHQAARSPE